MNGVLQALGAHGGWLGLLALVVAVAALVWASRLQKRVRTVTPDVRRLVRDMEGKSFEQVVEDLLGNMEFVAGRVGRLEVGLDDIRRQQTRSVQHVGLVRYNAEEGLGGELSFALALMDGDLNGCIITSVHTLSDCRIYLRNVQGGHCAHDLSEEEAAAFEMALDRQRREPTHASRVRRTRWRATHDEVAPRRRQPDKKGRTDGE